jgi:recombination protein RecA
MSNGVLKDKTKLLGVMAAVNKEFGVGTMQVASRVAFAHHIRIPTGIFSLDVAIGGGIPKGRTTMIVGGESVGKSTLCKLIAANFQHTCRECLQPYDWYTQEERDRDGNVKSAEVVIVTPCPCGKNTPHIVAYDDAEGTFDPAWAAALGVDVPSLVLFQPESAQQGSDIINALVRTGELDLAILDSIAAMTPEREIEESASKGQRPDQALLTNRLMRTIQASLNSLGLENQKKPAIIQVNQFRQKVGVMYGDPTTWPGGLGQNYAASILIEMRAGKQINGKGNLVDGSDKSKDELAQMRIGRELNFTVSKNKTFPPFKKGVFHLVNQDVPHLNLRKGHINNFEQMVEYGIHIGLVHKAGAWLDMHTEFGDEFVNPDVKSGNFQGVDKLIEFLRGQPDLVKKVRERIMNEVKNAAYATKGSAVAPADEEDEEDAA